jgi:hypothetical protein
MCTCMCSWLRSVKQSIHCCVARCVGVAYRLAAPQVCSSTSTQTATLTAHAAQSQVSSQNTDYATGSCCVSYSPTRHTTRHTPPNCLPPTVTHSLCVRVFPVRPLPLPSVSTNPHPCASLCVCLCVHTVTGKTMAENLASCPDLSAGQDVVLPLDKPIKETGHIQILYGNLAPEGSVAKITGKEGLKFTGQVGGVGCGLLDGIGWVPQGPAVPATAVRGVQGCWEAHVLQQRGGARRQHAQNIKLLLRLC